MPHVKGVDGKSYWKNPGKPLKKGEVLLSGKIVSKTQAEADKAAEKGKISVVEAPEETEEVQTEESKKEEAEATKTDKKESK